MNRFKQLRNFYGIFFVFILSHSLCSMDDQEFQLPAHRVKNYGELDRQRICVNTDGRPEKLEIMDMIQQVMMRSKGKLGPMLQTKFLTHLKNTNSRQSLSTAANLIVAIANHNLTFYTALHEKFSAEQRALKNPSQPLSFPELIPQDDIDQRNYFYNSLLAQIDVEMSMLGASAESKETNYNVLLYRYVKNVWDAKTTLILAKSLLDGRMGVPIAPQAEPVTREQYDALDGTDKVLLAHYLGQTEYHLEIVETLRPIFEAAKSGKIDAEKISKIAGWADDANAELRYFYISDLEMPQLEVAELDQIQPEKQVVNTKNKRRNKRKKGAPSEAQLSAIREEQRLLQETKKEEPAKFQRTQPNRAIPAQNDESLSSWWTRTEGQVSMRSLVQESIREHESRQTRKAAAKQAKNHIDIRDISEAALKDAIAVERPAEKLTIGGNYFSIFQEIMEQTYDGEITPVLTMIQNGLDGNVSQGSGSRLRLGLRNFDTRGLERLEIFMATEEQNLDSANSGSVNKTVVHTPHKHKSKRLRPEHVKSIRIFLQDAGYSLDTVGP